MSLYSRLRRLADKAPAPVVQSPPVVAVLDDGNRLALVRGEWVDWPDDRPLPPVCKIFLFDPRTL